MPSSGVFFSSTSSPSSIVESAADESSSSAPPSNLRVYSGSLSSEAPHFFTNTCPFGLFSSSQSLVAAVIPQVFQRPSQCASIGSLSLVAPTTILIKLFFLLSLLSAGCVCGSVGRCSSALCVLSLLLYRLNLRGTLGHISYNWRPTTGFDPTTRSPGPRGCFLCNHLPVCGRTFQQTM